MIAYEVKRNNVDLGEIHQLWHSYFEIEKGLASWEDALDAVDVFKLLSWDIEYLVRTQHDEEATT